MTADNDFPKGMVIPQGMLRQLRLAHPPLWPQAINEPIKFPSAPLYEITTDGIVVWVNNEVCSIGRFGVMGIDVHSADAVSCLHCTHQRTTAEDWETFKQDMLKYHSVHVSDEFKPERFR